LFRNSGIWYLYSICIPTVKREGGPWEAQAPVICLLSYNYIFYVMLRLKIDHEIFLVLLFCLLWSTQVFECNWLMTFFYLVWYCNLAGKRSVLFCRYDSTSE
jgi:hypothetical protein